jgi:hypothetical protein
MAFFIFCAFMYVHLSYLTYYVVAEFLGVIHLVNKERCEKLRKLFAEAKKNGGVSQIKLGLPDYVETHERLFNQFVKRHGVRYIE